MFDTMCKGESGEQNMQSRDADQSVPVDARAQDETSEQEEHG